MNVLRFARAAVVLFAVAALTACSSIHVESHQSGVIDAGSARTWAWGEVSADIDDAPIEDTRAYVERGMAARGLRRTDRAQAAWVIDLTFAVETAVRENDPWFSTFTVERYETGTLTLGLGDAATGERLWTGAGRSELRVSGVPNSPMGGALVDTEAPRDWHLARKVGEILDRLPAELLTGG